MAQTEKVVEEMFARFLNIEVPQPHRDRLVPLIERIENSISQDLDLSTVQGQNMLKVLLGTLASYAWGLGMHPYNNPVLDCSGEPLEVRSSKDILVPIRDVQAIRYVKKDKHGRVRKVLFEPDQNSRVRGQIDDLLTEISLRKWDSEGQWEGEDS